MTIASDGLGSILSDLATGNVPNALFQVVDTMAELRLLPHGSEGQLVYCKTTQCYYQLNADGSWGFVTSATALASQPAWYVEPTGNDDSDGKTLGTALATTDELMRRLWPGGRRQNLTNDVTAYINTNNPTATTFPQLLMNIGTSETGATPLTIYVFNVICGKVSSAPITLSADAILPIATINQRGQLQTAAGTFVDGEMIEITSSLNPPTLSIIGAVAYSTGLNGDAQHTFVGGFSMPTIPGSLVNGGHGQDIKPKAGDTCVVTQLVTQFNRVEVECTGFARVFIQYAKITRVSISGSSLNTPYAGIGGPVHISCCQMTSIGGRWENNCGGATLLQCRTPPTGKTTLYGNGWCIIDHCVQGRIALNGFVISYGLTLDGGNIWVGIGDDYNHPGDSVPSVWCCFSSYTNLFSGGSSGCIEFCNGSKITGRGYYQSAGIAVCEGSQLLNTDFNGYMWGATTSLYDFGVTIAANARVLQGNIAPGVFSQCWKIPSTQNIVCDNLFFTFSDNPIFLKNSNSGFLGGNYNVDNNYNLTDSGFYRKNQNANVSATNFYQIRQAGLYRVMGYVATTTADAAATGTPVLNCTWTDDSGVAQTKAVATGPALTTLGGNGGEIIIECGPNGTLASWSITGVGSAGNAKFSVRMRVEKDCYGA